MIFKIHIIISIAIITTIANPIGNRRDSVNINIIKIKLDLIHEIIERNVDRYSKIVFGASNEEIVAKLKLFDAFNVHEASKYLQEDEDSREGSNVLRAHILFRKLYLYSKTIYNDWKKTIYLRAENDQENIVLNFWRDIQPYLHDIETEFGFGTGKSNILADDPPQFEGHKYSDRDIRDFIIFKEIQLYKDHFLKYHKCLNSSADEEFLIKCR